MVGGIDDPMLTRVHELVGMILLLVVESARGNSNDCAWWNQHSAGSRTAWSDHNVVCVPEVGGLLRRVSPMHTRNEGKLAGQSLACQAFFDFFEGAADLFC
jgi:hypothetical protein